MWFFFLSFSFSLFLFLFYLFYFKLFSLSSLFLSSLSPLPSLFFTLTHTPTNKGGNRPSHTLNRQAWITIIGPEPGLLPIKGFIFGLAWSALKVVLKPVKKTRTSCLPLSSFNPFPFTYVHHYQMNNLITLIIFMATKSINEIILCSRHRFIILFYVYKYHSPLFFLRKNKTRSKFWNKKNVACTTLLLN